MESQMFLPKDWDIPGTKTKKTRGEKKKNKSFWHDTAHTDAEGTRESLSVKRIDTTRNILLCGGGCWIMSKVRTKFLATSWRRDRWNRQASKLFQLLNDQKCWKIKATGLIGEPINGSAKLFEQHILKSNRLKCFRWFKFCGYFMSWYRSKSAPSWQQGLHPVTYKSRIGNRHQKLIGSRIIHIHNIHQMNLMPTLFNSTQKQNKKEDLSP